MKDFSSYKIIKKQKPLLNSGFFIVLTFMTYTSHINMEVSSINEFSLRL